MTTDFRALCAELVDIVTAHCNPDDSAVGHCAAVLTRARAELDKPEPQGVSYRQLLAALESLIHKFDTEDCTTICELEPWKDLVSAAKDAQPEPVAPTDEALLASVRHFYGDQAAADMGAEDDLRTAHAVLALTARPTIQPVPVSERLPEPSVKVLAHYLNALGKGRTICAIWVPAKSRSDEGDLDADDFLEYDEERDKYHWPEGWYEAIENWEELGWAKVYEGEIVYWQPLPQWPATALPSPEATYD